QAIEAEATMRSKGVELTEATPEFIAATEAFVNEDLKTIEEQFTSLYGVENVPQKMETIAALVEKWKGKLEGVDAINGETYRKLLWDEIYSKVNPAAYG